MVFTLTRFLALLKLYYLRSHISGGIDNGLDMQVKCSTRKYKKPMRENENMAMIINLPFGNLVRSQIVHG
jgi:hypothetical protein